MNHGELVRRVGAGGEPKSGGAREESRQFVRSVAHHRDTKGLQPLERGRQIENRFCPRAHDDHGRTRELGEVARLVVGGIPMHTADAACGEHANSTGVGDTQRCGHGGGAIRLLCAGDSQIPRGHLPDAGASEKALELVGVQSERALPGHHARDHGHAARPFHGSDHPIRGLAVRGDGQPLREY